MTEPSSDDQSGHEPSTAEELALAREELARQLEVACATPVGQVTGETTGQLRRLDDALLAAARTTEGIIALKQRARSERQVATSAVEGGDQATEHVERIREFRDQRGEEWRAWAVTPGQASKSSTRNLGELSKGWLAFESLSGSGKRRLVEFPADWMMLSDADLERLLEQATEAPARKRASGFDAPSPD